MLTQIFRERRQRKAAVLEAEACLVEEKHSIMTHSKHETALDGPSPQNIIAAGQR